MGTQPLLTPVVKLGGSELSREWVDSLLEVRVEIQYQVPARVTLRFSDPDYGLVKDVHIATAVTVSSPDEPAAPLVSAEVTSIATEQREGGLPELLLVAMDKSFRMAQRVKADAFTNTTYSDIVSRLVSAAGMTADVESTTGTFEYVTQAGSDLALITELAHRSGYDWWVTGDTFHFKKPASGREVDLAMGVELRSFSARASSLRPGKITVGGWNRKEKQNLNGASSGGAGPKATSDLAQKAAHSDYELFTGNLGAQTQAEADTLAAAIADRAAAAAVTAKGVVEGTGQVALGVVAVVKDAGPLSGRYPVTAVEHVFRPSSGFVTRFASGERRPTGLVDAMGAVGGALQGGVPGSASFARRGVVVGLVTSINDPDKSGRVKVKFADGNQDVETGWARVVTVGGGPDRGSVWIPEVGDEVLVAFEDGNARAPVVIGGLHGQKDKMPVTEIKDGLVQSRAMTSRKGHVISMFDGEADSALAIELALQGKEHKIRLGKDALMVEVPSGKPVTIKSGNSKIEFAQSGDITISAPNITLKGEQSVKIQAAQVAVQAQATLDMKADAETKLSGAVLDMKGSGVAKLAGGMVQIN